MNGFNICLITNHLSKWFFSIRTCATSENNSLHYITHRQTSKHAQTAPAIKLAKTSFFLFSFYFFKYTYLANTIIVHLQTRHVATAPISKTNRSFSYHVSAEVAWPLPPIFARFSPRIDLVFSILCSKMSFLCLNGGRCFEECAWVAIFVRNRRRRNKPDTVSQLRNAIIQFARLLERTRK